MTYAPLDDLNDAFTYYWQSASMSAANVSLTGNCGTQCPGDCDHCPGTPRQEADPRICSSCGATKKELLTSLYCPNDCDKRVDTKKKEWVYSMPTESDYESI